MPGDGPPGGAGRLLLGWIPDWSRTAWWGLVGARLGRTVRVVDGAVVRGAGAAREVLLVVRPDVRGWELPGGHPDPGEALEDALRREVAEEVGVEVEVGERTGVYRRTGFLPHVAYVHLCAVRAGEARPGPEAPRVKWWPASALPATLLPWVRQPLADALAHRPGGAPVEREERNGIARILEAAWIDVRMRATRDRAS